MVHPTHHPQLMFFCGLILQQMRPIRHPQRPVILLHLLGQWLWCLYDCPLKRMVIFALMAALPIGVSYGRFEDGFAAFIIFMLVGFFTWRHIAR